MTRQLRRSQANRETLKLEARNVQDVRGQGHLDSRHQPFDLADATSGGATGDSTFLHSIDQSSAQSRANICCGQGIGLLSIYRRRRALQQLLLLSFVLTPVISLAQSTQTLPTQNEESLFRALMAVKSEDESRILLRSYKELITDTMWARFKEALTDLYKSGDSSRSLFLYRIEKQMAEELNDKPRLARILDKLGKGYLWIEDYGKAKEYSQQSIELANELKDKPLSVSVLLTLGTISTWQGNYREALEYLQKSLALSTELNDTESLADALANIGHIYSVIGNYAEAFRSYERAMDLVKVLNGRKRMQDLLTGLGIVYAEQGDYEKMAGYLNQSLQIAKELRDQTGIATILVDLGIANREQGHVDKALQNLLESLSIAEQIKSPGLIMDAQTALGSVYRLQGKYELGLEYLNKSRKAAEQIGDKPHIAVALWQIGELYNSNGDYSRAVEVLDRAITFANQIDSAEISYLALTAKGKAHEALKQSDLAQRSFLTAVSTIEQLRSQVSGGEQAFQRFFQNRVAPYHAMVGSLIGEGKPTEALAFAERAKARVLLDVIQNGRISIDASMSDKEQAEERRLYGELVSINARLRAERMAQPPDASRTTELENKLQNARNAYEAFQTAVYAAHPELKIKRGVFPAFTTEQASALLSDTGTTILEYVVTDEQTFLFVLSRDSTSQFKVGLKVYAIKIKRSDLSNLVDKHRSLLSTNHPGFRQIGRELYDLLIKPAEPYLKGKTAMCIVPDGPLWNLPFQALQTERDQYILEQYAIYYAPSLQVLREMRKRSDRLQSLPLSKSEQNGASSLPKAQIPQFYGIGNPAFGGEALARAQTLRNAPFVALPETENEVQTLAAGVYGLQSSSVRIGAAAREDAVKAEMSKYRVLHFATHGVLDDRNPLYSYIVLAVGGDSNEDGLLEAWELMKMDLKAEMVVLSACDTARGRVGDGEGMIGMTWALFVAGVPTTIASQWQVPSESTTKLMLGFHKNVVDGGSSDRKISKAEAWRQAVMGMMNDPRYRMKPYYWAGFVVVGDGGR